MRLPIGRLRVVPPPPPTTELDARWLRRAPFEWVWQLPVKVTGFELLGPSSGIYVTRLRVGNEDQLAGTEPIPIGLLLPDLKNGVPLVLPAAAPGIMVSIELWGEKLQGKQFAIRPAGIVAGQWKGPTP